MNWDTLSFNIATFICGVFVLDFGADKFIDHTVIVGRRLGISQTLIALLTVGAEYEELAVVIAAILQHRSPLALGNIIGSSISNILGAFSLGLLFQSAPVFGTADRFDVTAKIYTALTFLVTTVAVGVIYFDLLNRFTGVVLVVAFQVYVASIAYAIYRGFNIPVSDSDSESDDDSDSGIGEDDDTVVPATETSPLLHPTDLPPARQQRRKHRSLLYHIIQLLIGLVTLTLSGYVLSHSASSIADSLHLSGTVFGVTILSFATTLPEKLVAVLSGARGHGSIMVASTAGSNVFLLTLCLGVVAMTSSMPPSGVSGDKMVMFELGVAWASAAVFLFIVVFGGGRVAGAGLVAAYVAFLVLEFTVYRR